MKAFIAGRGPELARLLVAKAEELGFDSDTAVRTTTVEGFFVEPEIRDALVSGGVKPLPGQPTNPNKPTDPGGGSGGSGTAGGGGNPNSPQRSSRNKSQEVRNA